MQKKSSIKINSSSLNNKNNTNKIIDNTPTTTTTKYSNKLKNISSYLSTILWKSTKLNNTTTDDDHHKTNNYDTNVSIISNSNINSKANDIYVSDAQRLKIKRASEIQRINKLNSINNNIIYNNNNNNNNNNNATNSTTTNSSVIDQKGLTQDRSLRNNNSSLNSCTNKTSNNNSNTSIITSNNNNNVSLNFNPAYKDRYTMSPSQDVSNYDSYNTSNRLSNILSQRTTTNNNNNNIVSLNKKDTSFEKNIMIPYKKTDTVAHSVSVIPPIVHLAALCCDKCDGKHLTGDCPYYKKARDQHPDAQKKNKNQLGCVSTLPGGTLKHVQVIRQPGDGSCLFHSMAYGLNNTTTNSNSTNNSKCHNASKLRAEICNFIQNNPNLKISDTPLQDWVKWDSGTTVLEYSKKMSRGSWGGGGIEMACVSQLKDCNVHVYERIGSCYKRISAFDHPINQETKPIIRVLYCGGIHYDAMEVG